MPSVESSREKLHNQAAMEVTCWHCRAVFNPAVAGNRCPNCGHYPEAWLAKLRFAAVDFIGPAALLALVAFRFQEDPMFSVLFVIGALVWTSFILYEDVTNWMPTPDIPLTKPPMPETWRQSSASSDTGTSFAPSLVSGLTWAEQLLIAVLAFALIAYGALHWNQIAGVRGAKNISVTPVIYIAVFGGFIFYAVRRTSFDKKVLRDGVLTTGVLAGWYDKSSYTRTGYKVYIRIRYYFWTESGQKFEGSGTLTAGLSPDSLSINQEPLKVFYLPQDPSKNVALCCTTARPGS